MSSSGPEGRKNLARDASGRPLGFFDGRGWLNEEYLWGGGRLLGYYAWAWHTYLLHRSGVGSTSPVQTTDGAGAPQWDETFYPYGQQWNYANEANSWWQFYGGFSRYQADLDLYLTPNRFYSPNLDRWISSDPMGGNVLNPQSLNRYAYVNNNPASLTDPMGQEPCPEMWSSEGWQGNNYPGSNGSASCGDGAVTIDGNGDPLSSYIAAGEAAYASQLNIQFLNQSGLSHQGSWTIGGMNYSWMPTQFTQSGGVFHMTTAHWDAILKAAGDFSAGAGDVLTLSGTYWIRRWQGTDSLVNKRGIGYYSGAATGTALGIAISATGTAAKEGLTGANFGIGGRFNSVSRGIGRFVRFGWGWDNTLSAPRYVIRLSVGYKSLPFWWHLNVWP